MICHQTIAVPKEYNVRRHYDTMHQEKYEIFTGKIREEKVRTLQASFSIGVFIDLMKAFDTIDHKLLMKNYHYGIRVVFNWFISYLSNMKKYVHLNLTISPSLHINCGVPQGSILGSRLFIIYINDIINASHVANFIMFANDTNLFFNHPNLTFLFDIINTELSKISQWFKLNKLSSNIKKTNYIMFQAGNPTVAKDTNLYLIIDNVKIEQSILNQIEHIKFLGVIINSKLTWQEHI